VYELSVAVLSLLLMVGSFWGGLIVQRFLRDVHRSRESVESIRVVITLLVTFAALVLGLLISSSQARFSASEASLRGLSIQITELDQRLREYGSTADPLRVELILYTKAAIADTWPDEPAPPGNYPRHLRRVGDNELESAELGALLNQIDMAIRHLTPDNAFQSSIAASLQTRMVALLDQRWNLIVNAEPSLSWPFVAILVFWLGVIFVIAGLSSPRNLLVFTVTMLATVSLASSIFLALELDTPVTGFIALSSAPLRNALLHITLPPLPGGAS
jgi:hypothetical protein